MRAIFCFLSTILFLIGAPRLAQADDWSACKVAGTDAKIAACSRIIAKGERDPKELAMARRYRASAYYRLRDQDKAIEDLNQAIRLDPENTAFFRGHIRLVEKEFDAAIALFSEAIQAHPDNSEFYNSRGATPERETQNAPSRITMPRSGSSRHPWWRSTTGAAPIGTKAISNTP